MSNKKTNHSPGLSPIEGNQFSLGIQIRSRDKFTSLSLGTMKVSPSGPMLVNYPAIELMLYRSPRDPQGRLRSHETMNRATPRELLRDLITSYPGMPRDPTEPHDVSDRDAIQHPLALLKQQLCCSNGLK
jgi:hypothetical protein